MYNDPKGNTLDTDIKFRIHGALAGFMLGDMLSNKLQEKTGLFEYSHISATMLATGHSLTSMDEIDTSDIIEQLHNMYIGSFMVQNDELLTCGPSLIETITHSLDGMPADKTGVEASEDDEYLALVLSTAVFRVGRELPEFIADIHQVCKLVNQTEQAQVYSALYAILIRNLILQEQSKAMAVLQELYTEQGLEKHSQVLSDIASNRPNNCFWLAWNSFINNKEDFGHAIKACSESGQPNLASALCGSFWGASNGKNDIPFKWIKELDLSLGTDAVKTTNRLMGMSE